MGALCFLAHPFSNPFTANLTTDITYIILTWFRVILYLTKPLANNSDSSQCSQNMGVPHILSALAQLSHNVLHQPLGWSPSHFISTKTSSPVLDDFLQVQTGGQPLQALPFLTSAYFSCTTWSLHIPPPLLTTFSLTPKTWRVLLPLLLNTIPNPITPLPPSL